MKYCLHHKWKCRIQWILLVLKINTLGMKISVNLTLKVVADEMLIFSDEYLIVIVKWLWHWTLVHHFCQRRYGVCNTSMLWLFYMMTECMRWKNSLVSSIRFRGPQLNELFSLCGYLSVQDLILVLHYLWCWTLMNSGALQLPPDSQWSLDIWQHWRAKLPCLVDDAFMLISAKMTRGHCS